MDCQRDINYMKMALKEAKKAAEKQEVPIGAILVVDDKVVAKAHNLRKKTEMTTAHAEILCLQKANKKFKKWRLEKAVMYVTVEPCPMCAGALLQARIKKLVYGANDEKAGCVGSIYNLLQDRNFNHKVEVKSGVLKEECSDIMKKFFQKLRKKKEKQLININNLI